MANGEGQYGGASTGGTSKTTGLTLIALVFTFCSLVLTGFCCWTQWQLTMENSRLKEDVGELGTRVQLAEDKLSEMILPGGHVVEKEERSHEMMLSRLKRSSGSGRKANRGVQAVHFWLDVPAQGDATQLKWKISNVSATNGGGSRGHHTSDLVHLSQDRQSVTMKEPGLYFIYVQIQFENAKPRNAFAVKVDHTPILKCFQSLDYFNQTLTVKDNSRLKPCYSAAAVVLRKDQHITIANLYAANRIFNDHLSSYWGLVRLSE